MNHAFADALIAALNDRDPAKVTSFYADDAVLLSPDDSGDGNSSQQVKASGRLQIRQVWDDRLARQEYSDAKLEAVCQGVATTALVYRIHNKLVVDLLTFTPTGLIKAALAHFSSANRGYAFISYARGTGMVMQLAAFLEREELPPWVDNQLRLGELWDDVITNRIVGASAFLIGMDEKSAQSEYVKKELGIALRLGKPIIPILIKGEPFQELRDRQFVRITRLMYPESGFVEQLRDLVAPHQIPSPALKRRRVDYFVRKLLGSYYPDAPPSGGSFGVGMSYSLPLSPTHSLSDLDELDWAGIFVEIHENIPSVDFVALLGEEYYRYGEVFPTPDALVDFLTSVLTWPQIRHLGERTEAMRRIGSDG